LGSINPVGVRSSDLSKVENKKFSRELNNHGQAKAAYAKAKQYVAQLFNGVR